MVRSSFTFHYGSILILQSKWIIQIYLIYIPLWFYSNSLIRLKNCKIIQIYIPLWFYSNALICSLVYSPSVFTFHYGSILMPLSLSKSVSMSTFTFHYGSILISVLLMSRGFDTNLHSTMVLF